MRTIRYIGLLIVAIALASCKPNEPTESVLLDIPLSMTAGHGIRYISAASGEQTLPGDPGEDDRLAPPVFLYAWAYVQLNDNSWHVIRPVNRESDGAIHLTAADWEYVLDGGSEKKNGHYELSDAGKLQFKIDKLPHTGAFGRVYAVACNQAYTFDEIAENQTNEAACKAAIEALTLNTASWFDTPATAAEMSTALRDLYATPSVRRTEMGKLTYADNKITIDTLRLYHCAAKVDFKWEVDSALQATQQMVSIEVTNLPTVCKVFEPTACSAGSGTCSLLASTDAVNGHTPGNRWIGREYAYVLQQPSGALNYTVEIANRAGGAKSFVPSPIDNTYTGWYRVIATIK